MPLPEDTEVVHTCDKAFFLHILQWNSLFSGGKYCCLTAWRVAAYTRLRMHTSHQPDCQAELPPCISLSCDTGHNAVNAARSAARNGGKLPTSKKLSSLRNLYSNTMALARAACASAATLQKLAAPVANQSSRALATKASERPLSPHLTIYRLPLNAMTSVTFRGCGIAMTVGESQFRSDMPYIASAESTLTFHAGVGGLAMGLAATGTTMPELVHSIQQAGVGPLARFAVAFPLAFHWGNGLRHMVCPYEVVHLCSTCIYVCLQMWENIRGHEVAEVDQSAYALIAGAGAISVIAAVLEFEK